MKEMTICLIVAIVFGILGFLIGTYCKTRELLYSYREDYDDYLKDNSGDYIGTYRSTIIYNTNTITPTKEHVIYLLNDSNCIIDDSKGKWHYQDGIVFFEIPESMYNNDGSIKEIIDNKEALVVDKGLYYLGKFYEKVK